MRSLKMKYFICILFLILIFYTIPSEATNGGTTESPVKPLAERIIKLRERLTFAIKRLNLSDKEQTVLKEDVVHLNSIEAKVKVTNTPSVNQEIGKELTKLEISVDKKLENYFTDPIVTKQDLQKWLNFLIDRLTEGLNNSKIDTKDRIALNDYVVQFKQLSLAINGAKDQVVINTIHNEILRLETKVDFDLKKYETNKPSIDSITERSTVTTIDSFISVSTVGTNPVMTKELLNGRVEKLNKRISNGLSDTRIGDSVKNELNAEVDQLIEIENTMSDDRPDVLPIIDKRLKHIEGMVNDLLNNKQNNESHAIQTTQPTVPQSTQLSKTVNVTQLQEKVEYLNKILNYMLRTLMSNPDAYNILKYHQDHLNQLAIDLVEAKSDNLIELIDKRLQSLEQTINKDITKYENKVNSTQTSMPSTLTSMTTQTLMPSTISMTTWTSTSITTQTSEPLTTQTSMPSMETTVLLQTKSSDSVTVQTLQEEVKTLNKKLMDEMEKLKSNSDAIKALQTDMNALNRLSADLYSVRTPEVLEVMVERLQTMEKAIDEDFELYDMEYTRAPTLHPILTTPSTDWITIRTLKEKVKNLNLLLINAIKSLRNNPNAIKTLRADQGYLSELYNEVLMAKNKKIVEILDKRLNNFEETVKEDVEKFAVNVTTKSTEPTVIPSTDQLTDYSSTTQLPGAVSVKVLQERVENFSEILSDALNRLQFNAEATNALGSDLAHLNKLSSAINKAKTAAIIQALDTKLRKLEIHISNDLNKYEESDDQKTTIGKIMTTTTEVDVQTTTLLSNSLTVQTLREKLNNLRDLLNEGMEKFDNNSDAINDFQNDSDILIQLSNDLNGVRTPSLLDVLENNIKHLEIEIKKHLNKYEIINASIVQTTTNTTATTITTTTTTQSSGPFTIHTLQEMVKNLNKSLSDAIHRLGSNTEALKALQTDVNHLNQLSLDITEAKTDAIIKLIYNRLKGLEQTAYDNIKRYVYSNTTVHTRHGKQLMDSITIQTLSDKIQNMNKTLTDVINKLNNNTGAAQVLRTDLDNLTQLSEQVQSAKTAQLVRAIDSRLKSLEQTIDENVRKYQNYIQMDSPVPTHRLENRLRELMNRITEIRVRYALNETTKELLDSEESILNTVVTEIQSPETDSEVEALDSLITEVEHRVIDLIRPYVIQIAPKASNEHGRSTTKPSTVTQTTVTSKIINTITNTRAPNVMTVPTIQSNEFVAIIEQELEEKLVVLLANLTDGIKNMKLKSSDQNMLIEELKQLDQMERQLKSNTNPSALRELFKSVENFQKKITTDLNNFEFKSTHTMDGLMERIDILREKIIEAMNSTDFNEMDKNLFQIDLDKLNSFKQQLRHRSLSMDLIIAMNEKLTSIESDVNFELNNNTPHVGPYPIPYLHATQPPIRSITTTNPLSTTVPNVTTIPILAQPTNRTDSHTYITHILNGSLSITSPNSGHNRQPVLTIPIIFVIILMQCF